MSSNTRIEWTDHTWNITAGCMEVSPGCDNCYARGMSARIAGAAEKRIRDSTAPGRTGAYCGVVQNNKWTGIVRPIPEAFAEPERWNKPRRVFVNSMSDLFHGGIKTQFIRRAFRVMGMYPRHKFQVLTKRPARMLHLLGNHVHHPPPNIIVGVSAEDQFYYDARWKYLGGLKRLGWKTFISAEPLLGPITLRGIAVRGAAAFPDWIIVGGESGPRARRMQPSWAFTLRRQCHEIGIPFFFKQWGTYGPDGGKIDKAEQHLLDGREYRQYPD